MVSSGSETARARARRSEQGTLTNGGLKTRVANGKLVIEREGKVSARVTVHHSAVFSTWIGLKRKLENVRDCKRVVLDLSSVALVDHTVMHKLEEMEEEFQEHGCTLVVEGLDQHRKLSDHPAAARVRGA